MINRFTVLAALALPTAFYGQTPNAASAPGQNVAATAQQGADNFAYGFQEADANALTITQVGTDNVGVVEQYSSGNAASLLVTGDDNAASITQQAGNGNEAETLVRGDGNYVIFSQDGEGNAGFTNVTGDAPGVPTGRPALAQSDDNEVSILQSQTGNEASTFVGGVGNAVVHVQNGEANTAGAGRDADGIQVYGDRNRVHTTQNGDGNDVDADVVGLDNGGLLGGVDVEQYGDRNAADLLILGDANTIDVSQFGSGNRATVTADGANNVSTVVQRN